MTVLDLTRNEKTFEQNWVTTTSVEHSVIMVTEVTFSYATLVPNGRCSNGKLSLNKRDIDHEVK